MERKIRNHQNSKINMSSQEKSKAHKLDTELKIQIYLNECEAKLWRSCFGGNRKLKIERKIRNHQNSKINMSSQEKSKAHKLGTELKIQVYLNECETKLWRSCFGGNRKLKIERKIRNHQNSKINKRHTNQQKNTRLMSQSLHLGILNANQNFFFKLIILQLMISTYQCADTSEELTINKFSVWERWVYGILSGISLGLVGFLSALSVVYLKKQTKIQFSSFLKLLISFAAGALIGDAVIHLIPDAFSKSEDPSEEVDPRILSLFISFGIVIFAVFERLFNILGIVHNHGPEENTCQQIKICSDRCCDQEQQNNQIQTNIFQQNDQNEVEENGQLPQPGAINNECNENQMVRRITPPLCNEIKIEESSPCKDNQTSAIDLTKGWKYKKVEAYLNQMSDFLHNIMDGIALGVAFSTSDKQQVATTIIAIFAHEIPQEMGNASILMSSNFSSKQAMMCNGLVNFSAIIGIIIGILITTTNQRTEQIMNCFIAGNFLFIGGTEMLSKLSAERSNRMGSLQIISLCCGFGVMFLLLLGE